MNFIEGKGFKNAKNFKKYLPEKRNTCQALNWCKKSEKSIEPFISACFHLVSNGQTYTYNIIFGKVDSCNWKIENYKNAWQLKRSSLAVAVNFGIPPYSH